MLWFILGREAVRIFTVFLLFFFSLSWTTLCSSSYLSASVWSLHSVHLIQLPKCASLKTSCSCNETLWAGFAAFLGATWQSCGAGMACGCVGIPAAHQDAACQRGDELLLLELPAREHWVPPASTQVSKGCRICSLAILLWRFCSQVQI